MVGRVGATAATSRATAATSRARRGRQNAGEADAGGRRRRYSLYLLYWYKSTHTDAAAAATLGERTLLQATGWGAPLPGFSTQFTCFTSAKVQVLTLLGRAVTSGIHNRVHSLASRPAR